ncbi:MAG: hypothetical protein WCK65_14175 [Rhodospirillaceae bacterium]
MTDNSFVQPEFPRIYLGPQRRAFREIGTATGRTAGDPGADAEVNSPADAVPAFAMVLDQGHIASEQRPVWTGAALVGHSILMNYISKSG